MSNRAPGPGASKSSAAGESGTSAGAAGPGEVTPPAPLIRSYGALPPEENSRKPPYPTVPDNRRRSFLGPFDREIGLRFYVEGWRAKVERNGSLNLPRGSATRPHGDPLVTVAIRSDGSVESVRIERTSGMVELDEAVQRIVTMLAPYSAFPPDMARQYDVIEIRRVWVFGDTLQVLEDVH